MKSQPSNVPRLAIVAALTMLLGPAATLPAAGQSADALLDKLVEKGVLTVDEANELRDETDKDFTRAHQVKTGMPDWVTSLRFSGDLRVRYDGTYSGNPAFVDRDRFRYRLRFGTVATLLDDFEVGFRLGSGDFDSASTITSGIDPISLNQSFQNDASKKGIFIDQAYAKWTPLNSPTWAGAVTIGKMENPFTLSDMIFDVDYTPEGAAQQISYTFSPEHTLRANFGQFILDESSSQTDDPYMLGAQLRADSQWNKEWGTSVGFAFLSIQDAQNLSSSDVPNINVGNDRFYSVSPAGVVTLNNLAQAFNTLVLDAAVTYTLESFPRYAGPFPIRVFAEFAENFDTDDQNNAYQIGITFGRAGRKGTWEISYRYRRLEGNAWYEEVTDSEFGAFYTDSLPIPGVLPASGLGPAHAPGIGYGTGTNARGSIVKATYSVYDFLALSVSWFYTDLIEGNLAGSAPSGDTTINRVLIDAAFKF